MKFVTLQLQHQRQALGVQTDAVSTQTARVKQLKDQAATGKVSVSKVKQEESVLTKMKVSFLTHHALGLMPTLGL